MTALYIILAVVAVIMLLLLIPADCILEFSYNNKENNGSVIIKYAFFRMTGLKKKLKTKKKRPTKKKSKKNRIF